MSTTRRSFIAQSMLMAAGLSAGKPVSGSFLEQEKFGKIEITEKVAAPGNFKICVFSKHLHWLDYTQMAAVARQIGFDGIDLTVRPDGHVLPERVTEDLPKAVDAAHKAGLQIYMLTTGITDPAHPHTESILKTASKLGIQNYRTGWLDYQENLNIPQNLETFKAKLGKLAELNRKYNIHGDYQNHSGTSLGASLWDLWLVLKDINPQWLGCQYDIRHATVEGANSWPIGLELIHPYVRTIDIKDFHWTQQNGKWVIENVPLGIGMVDFSKYIKLLKKYNIAGPVSLHFEYPLGGAEHGAKELTIPKEKVIQAMQQDLNTLRTWLRGGGMN